LTLESTTGASGQVKATIESVTWKGLRCTAEVSSQSSELSLDIRTKPVQASSSLVAQPKPLVGGKASLAIVDDEQMGAAAVVVVLDTHGNVIQKMATTVGG
jgi:hypothetical protein